MEFLLILPVYLTVINIAAIIMTIADKKRAVRGKWRISEFSLMLLGFLGGAAGEFITMKKIHHKTRHAKFMIGLPLEIFFHIVILILIIYKVAF